MNLRTAMFLTFLAAMPAAATAAVPAHQQALALVQSLYHGERTPERVETFFAADLAKAYRKDGSNPDEVGAIDFDWRYGAQDTEITGLAFSQMEGPKAATVTVRFKNFGKPGVVVYELCHATRGWRIADVHKSGEDAWDLRVLLKLPKEVKC